MDHRRKHAGYRSLVEEDYEAGKTGGPAPHPPGSRRSRLNALALVSLGLVVAFVGIMTVVHFSHVNNLYLAPAKTTTSGSVVVRREEIENGARDGTAGGPGSGGGGGAAGGTAGGGAAAGAASEEPGLGDMDDEYGSEDDGTTGAVGEEDDDGAANDEPIDKGDKDDDGAANDQPFDKGDKDDDGAANDQPFDKGDRDDDGAANDQPFDKGDRDDDGAANDEPIDKGDKDDDGAANDHPIDKGDKDDDGAANDEPIDKGDKDDDGAANDEPIDKGDKDDDGAANDEPIDKGEKDDDGSANDHPIDKGDKDDDGPVNDHPIDKGKRNEDGAQHDTSGDLDEMYEPDQEDDGTAAAAAASGSDGNDGKSASPAAAAAAAAAGSSGDGNAAAGTSDTASAATAAKEPSGGKGGIAGASRAAALGSAGGDATTAAGSAADESNPEEVDEVTDYDDDDGDTGELYVDVDADADDYDADHDVDLRTLGKLQQQGQSQSQQQIQTREQTRQKPEGQQKSAPESGAAAAAAVAVAVPPDVCGPLSRELLGQWAQNNTVLLTFTNSIMFRTFGPTWLHHVRKAGIQYWVLAVADNETARLVRSQGADHCFLVHENEIDDTAAAFKWGSRSWQLHTWQKVLVVRHVHHLGFHVINSDLDVVWLRNPLEHFLVKYTAPDYWVSMDPITTQNPIGDDGPELGVSTHHYMNTGVYFLRQTPGGRALIDKWYDIREDMQRSGFHDQDGLYNYFKEGGQEVDSRLRVTKVVDGKTALAQLPATLFQNGYSHCINQIHKLHGLQPFEVHFVWVWGGNAGKINRMREQMYYIDPPSYHSDGLFLSYDVEAIEEPADFNRWTDTEAMVQTHLRALDSQLTDTWHGLALAALTNRIVVLPKMKCFCIQNWFENPQCRLPGEPHTRFPLSPACPADYVFNMDALAALNVSGRPIGFREFSFLDNERTPPEVKERPLVVVARRGASAAHRDGDTLTIPAGLKSDALLAALKPFLEPQKGPQNEAPQPPKRLHFANPRLALAGWSDPRVGADFETAVAGLAVRWCCRPDAVAKQHGVEVGHQLKLHAAAEAEAVSRRLLQLR